MDRTANDDEGVCLQESNNPLKSPLMRDDNV